MIRFPSAVAVPTLAILGELLLPAAVSADPPRPSSRWVFSAQTFQDGRVPDTEGGPDARVIGNPEIITGMLGESLILDGYDDRLVIADDFKTCLDRLPSRAMTVSAWVLVHTPTRWGGIIDVIQDNGDAEEGWILGYDEDSFYFGLSTAGADDGDGLLTYLDGTTPLVPGKWHHVVATYDGAMMRLFVNGRPDAESDAQSGDINYPGRGPYVIGAYVDDNECYPMHGRLREVAVYDRALENLEIMELFAPSSDLAALPAVQDTRLWMLVQPYLQNVTRTGITVMWETSRPTSSLVRYGTALPLTESVSSDDPVNIHELRLEGLKPQTPYFYQVVSVDELGQELESAVYTFQTAVEEGTPFSFTVLADTQASPEVLHTLAERCFAQRPNFTLIAGDLVSTGTSKIDWTSHFFPNMHPLISRAAFFPAMGNHDQDADWYYRYIAAPDPEYCYDFRYGNAHFFMIDTNRPVDPKSEQYAWLDERLAASDADWKFAVHHHPPYTSDENDYGDAWEGASTHGDLDVRALAPLYEKHGVDIVFNGHIHVYERTWPIRDQRVVEEGGVIYITAGGAGGGLENFAPSKAWFSNTVRRTHHYCYVAINGGTLQFKAFDVDGRLFDALSLEKTP